MIGTRPPMLLSPTRILVNCPNLKTEIYNTPGSFKENMWQISNNVKILTYQTQREKSLASNLLKQPPFLRLLKLSIYWYNHLPCGNTSPHGGTP